jgi:glycine betaine catabolism A
MMQASLRRAAYCDAEVFADEQVRLMATSWACVGRVDALGTEPGSYRLASVAGESVLMVRAADLSVAVFANRCMHRGTELVDTTVDSGSACFESVIRCPYHFWAYGLDGSLRASPWADVEHPEDFALRRYELAEWGGFHFVRLSGHGADFLDELGSIAERLVRFPLDALVVGRSFSYDVAANWKVIAENYNECYHCGPVHPELCELVPAFRQRGGADLDWAQGIPHRDGADTFTRSGTSTRASFPGLNAAEQANHFGELVYPNLLLSLSRDHVAAFVLQPQACDRTAIECLLLFHREEVAKPGFDPTDAADFWDVVNRQDWSICERVQRGMRSHTFEHGWYAPMEDPSLDIRRWWITKMGSS